MEIKKLEAAIEAILFTMGESVELSQIADAIQQDKETTRKIIQNMMDKYQKKDRGIQIIELEQSYQLCSKKEYYEIIKYFKFQNIEVKKKIKFIQISYKEF